MQNFKTIINIQSVFGDLIAIGLWSYAWGYGAMGLWGYGDMGIWGYGAMGLWGYGDMGIWGYGDMGL